MPSAIEDYALIGDCETAALVARDGSIDWLCWPRFDSAACFAALLGNEGNGRWQIVPERVRTVRRQYRKKTLILDTEFDTPEGSVTLTDFMPLREQHSDIVRVVKGTRGRVAMKMDLVIRFDYGSTVPWVTSNGGGTLTAVAGPHKLVLRTPVRLRGEELRTVARFDVQRGETVAFNLTYGPSNRGQPRGVDAEASLRATERWWREWSGQCVYKGRWSEAVDRSLITLKALTFLPTGGVLAAATSSLPEVLGGSRNWDYRFCWLRDATFTLFALMEAGYYDEARAWRDWLIRTAAGSPNQVQVLYGVAGERQYFEWEVPWLKGFGGASPVRVGNAAAGQLQLDVYGEIADALHQARMGKVEESKPAIGLEHALLDHLEEIWQKPDQGIWEFRGEQRHFTHSKVMAWVAFDRMVRNCERFGWDGPIERWRKTRAEIHAQVCEQGFDAKLGSFVQSYGSKELDASLLRIPLVGFLPASDPRVASTVRQIEQRLMWKGLVRRYDTEKAGDGLPPGEGAFLACTFWLADNYVLAGRRQEAEHLLEQLLLLRNDVGLLSEEYDPEDKRFLGNIPQAFSHVALVNTIMNLTQKAAPVHHRSGMSRRSARDMRRRRKSKRS